MRQVLLDAEKASVEPGGGKCLTNGSMLSGKGSSTALPNSKDPPEAAVESKSTRSALTVQWDFHHHPHYPVLRLKRAASSKPPCESVPPQKS
jgi:hypothetical protein